MSILSDNGILLRMHNAPMRVRDDDLIVIDPFTPEALQGASIDLKLGAEILDEYGKRFILEPGNSYFLNPHEVCLAHTLEHVKIPTDCVARVEGKSSIGRQFVSVHQTAGWIDPGFYGNITLELVNHTRNKIFKLEYGMYICQLTFLTLDQAADRVYKGRYQGDKGAQGYKLG